MLGPLNEQARVVLKMVSRPPKVSDEQGTANEEDARDAANAPAPACASAATLLLLLPCGCVPCLIYLFMFVCQISLIWTFHMSRHMNLFICLCISFNALLLYMLPLTFVVISWWRNRDLIGLQIICWHERLLLRRHFADCRRKLISRCDSPNRF